MRILLISSWFPYPPINGAKMRVYNLFKRLGERHELHLYTFAQSDEEMHYKNEILEFCRDVHIVRARPFSPSVKTAAAGLLSIKPRSSIECYSEEMAALIRDALSTHRFDAAAAFTLRAAEYIADVPDLPKVLDDDNAEAAFMRRQAEQQPGKLSKFRHTMTWVKARMHERRIALKFDAVTVVSEEDRMEVAGVVPELTEHEAIVVVPNGVDLKLLDYDTPQRDRLSLVYTGALSYFANADAVRYFCKDILPLVKRNIPDVKLLVTGSTENVDDIEDLKAAGGVVFTGFVPDIRPVVAGAAALIVPVRQGGGTRLKVLEAMALGTPVVATTFGAMGLGAVNGEHILIADDPEAFAHAVVSVMTDPELSHRLSSNAKEFVKTRFGWDKVAEKLDQTIRLAVRLKGEKTCVGTATI